MTYNETLQYLYASTPVFEHQGASAYKPGLATSMALDDYFGHPHKAYDTIHVGGTNGKGSVSHTLAAILQKAGYKVGLYTSPHLVDFCERIRVNGGKVDREFVVSFVEKHRAFFEPLHPSFFELVTAMAFEYFKVMEVDIAVIEVGLGGRLDSTNIITPVLSIITNVSLDHTALLGDTLGEIAYEKAGIIKKYRPVLIGEVYEELIVDIFYKKAREMDSLIYFADDGTAAESDIVMENGAWTFKSVDFGELAYGLHGMAQVRNGMTVLYALRVLNEDILPEELPLEAIAEGFRHAASITGLRGRWEYISESPRIIADIGHNAAAWRWIIPMLAVHAVGNAKVSIVMGFSADKDVDAIIKLLPKDGHYIFTSAASDRAMPARVLAEKAYAAGLQGVVHPSVEEAAACAMERAGQYGATLISGSNFVVAEALSYFDSLPADGARLL